jgi:hypothetical protein
MHFLQHMKALIIISGAAILFCSCSSSFSSPEAMAPNADYSKRQIQRSGTINMKSRSLESSSEKSIALIAHHQAIITSSSLTDDRYKASIRVPSNNLSSLMQSLESVGKITSSHVSMDDVTAAYLDLEATLKNKRALRDRLRALLSQATKVEDILKIEKELSRVQTDLDQTDARMKSMRSKVAKSTLNLSIIRQRIPGPLGIFSKSGGWIFDKLNYLN